MKKLLTILTLLSAFLLTACGPSYDYSSPEKFMDSIEKQAKEEKIELRDAEEIVGAYLATKVLEDTEGCVKTALACEDEAELAEECWLFVKKHTNGKTLEQMKSDTFPLFVAMNKDKGRDLEKAMSSFGMDFFEGYTKPFSKSEKKR